MAMVCPQCNGTFDQALQCPNCGVRLLYQAPARKSGWVGVEDAWQQTPWGRLLVGLILAQGLYYGLRQFAMAGYMALRADSPVSGSINSILGELALIQGIQALGVLGAGVLIAAGNRGGVIYGAVVGLWNGTLFLMADYVLANFGQTGSTAGRAGPKEPTLLGLLEQPMLQCVIGAVGGYIGKSIWRPVPEVNLSTSRPATLPEATLMPSPSAFAGPVAWVRVTVGTALAVVGVLWANTILDFVMFATENKLRIDTQLQAQLVTWEICGLAILLGAFFAGATTANGMKQGAWVGLATASILFAIPWFRVLIPATLTSFAVVSAGPLGLVGGWFGGQLLPPSSNKARIKTFDID